MSHRRECTLGVDVGTSSTKGVLVDSEGVVVATEIREHELARPKPGWVEMDGRVWWDEFASISRSLLARSDVDIVAVGVSGMGPCVLLTDDSDEPVRPAILYGVDSRAALQIARLERQLGVENIASEGGSRLTSQAAGPKIAWIAENEPADYQRARRLYMPASWLVRKLTNAYVLDRHSASQCTPMYDLAGESWHHSWAELVAPGIALPSLRWAGEVAGRVTAVAAGISGLPEGIPVIVGSVDAWMEAASVGADRVGDLMIMYGSTTFMIATTAEPVRVPSMWTTAGVSAGKWSLAGGMATTGSLTLWVRDLVGGSEREPPTFEQLTDEASAVGMGAHGLIMLPYFAGERTPLLDPLARGVIAGLSLSHSRGDLYRAALEATAFGVRHNVEVLRDAGVTVERVFAVGGGTRGELWTHIVSDITGLTQLVRRTTVGASYGAAYLARAAIDWATASIDDWNPVVDAVSPDDNLAEDYDRLYALYRQLYDSTSSVVHELAERQIRGAV